MLLGVFDLCVGVNGMLQITSAVHVKGTVQYSPVSGRGFCEEQQCSRSNQGNEWLSRSANVQSDGGYGLTEEAKSFSIFSGTTFKIVRRLEACISYSSCSVSCDIHSVAIT